MCAGRAAAGEAGAAKLRTSGRWLAGAGDERRLRCRAQAPASLPRRLRRPRHGVGLNQRAALSLSAPDPRHGLGSALADEPLEQRTDLLLAEGGRRRLALGPLAHPAPVLTQ